MTLKSRAISRVTMVRLLMAQLGRSPLLDVLVGAAVGSVIGLVLAFVVHYRVDAFTFQAKSDFGGRTTIDASDYASQSNSLDVLQVNDVGLQRVREGPDGEPATDVSRTEHVTVMVVGGDLSELRKYFGENVPSGVSTGVLLDRQSAQALHVGKADQVALLLGLTTDDEVPNVIGTIAGVTLPYADPLDPIAAHGLLILRHQDLPAGTLGRLTETTDPRTQGRVFRYFTVGSTAPNQESRWQLAQRAALGGEGVVRTVLGTAGVAAFGALLWLAVVWRQVRRADDRTAQVRAILLATGASAKSLRSTMTMIHATRTAFAAFLGALLVNAFALRLVLGYVSQVAVAGVVAAYLVVFALPMIWWSRVRQKRLPQRLVQALYTTES